MVILATRNILSPEQFDEWGWRVPFWVSIIMVGVSYLIRKIWTSLRFLQNQKKHKYKPFKESFGNRYNLKFVLHYLEPLWVKGCMVYWTILRHEFYENCNVIDSSQVDTLLGIALILGTPFFIVFGWLSDKLGRKYIMMGGMLLAILLYRPIYKQMFETTNVKNKTEIVANTKIVSELKENKKQTMDSIYTTNKEYSDGTTLLEVKP
jgi:MFS family permease